MVIDTFSKRQKRAKGEQVEIFTYNNIDPKLRVQIVRIWDAALGEEYPSQYTPANPVYRLLHQMLATEFGLFSFGIGVGSDYEFLVKYFMDAVTEHALDMIDFSFRVVLRGQADWEWQQTYKVRLSPDEAIDDLNERFLEHGVGYTFVSGDSPGLIRRDNELLHKETVLPALQLLHEESFEGATAEYFNAHEHYRHGRHKECLNDCLKAFESTMKTICAKRQWPYTDKDTASALIDICIGNGLFPAFLQTHFGTIKSALESAIPTIRNRLGGHGQGSEPKEVPPFYAEYLLYETATTIAFLVKAYKSLG